MSGKLFMERLLGNMILIPLIPFKWFTLDDMNLGFMPAICTCIVIFP